MALAGLAGAVLAVAVLATTLALAGCSSTVAGTPVVPPDTVTATVTRTVTAAPTGSGPAGDTVGAPTGTAVIRTDPLTTPDPCTLLTQDEAGQLAGRTLQAGIASGPAGTPTMCQYTSDPNEPGVAQVTVQVGDGVKKYLDIDKDTLGHPFTQVDDLGDEAWQEDDAIFVRHGNLWIGITLVLLNDPAENAQPLRAAATIAVGRA
jgi:hypothetical protein